MKPRVHSPVPDRSRRPWRGLACGFVLVAAVVTGCGEEEHSLRRVRDGEAAVTSSGVLVIVVDGLRWDHTSLAGYDRETTPFLKQLAREALVFSNAWSPSPSIVGSHVAILSGCDPSLAQPPDVRATMGSAASRASGDASVGGVEPTDDNTWFVPEDLWLLGRPFLGAGWTTAAFVDHPMMGELRGLDRGFRKFDKFVEEAGDSERTIGTYAVGLRFVKWLNGLPIDQNWFAYVQLNDLERAWYRGRRRAAARQGDEGANDWRPRPELAFVPPLGLTEPLFHALPPSRANPRHAIPLSEYELRYDQAIRALDRNLFHIIDAADAYGRDEDLTIVIMGSFGTGFGEHGLYLQAGLAEDEDLHVPLLIRPSKALRKSLGWSEVERGAWRETDALVGLIDVAPTITDLAGVEQRERVHGLSLRRLLDGSGDTVRARVFARPSVLPGFAIIEGGRSVAVYDPSRALPTVASSWSRGREESAEGLENPRFMGLWRQWEGLLRQERRALHFGVGSFDRASADKIRRLQGATATNDGTPKEDPSSERAPRTGGSAPGPGGESAGRGGQR